jgi:L-fuconolactonase
MTRWIDAHQHFWHYSAEEYGWIDGRMEALRRDFLPPHLIGEMIRTGVDGTIAVQARQTLADTEWLLDLSKAYPFIAGVVGWAPLTSPEFTALLDSLATYPKLRGLRHVLQDEPDEAYMLRDTFNHGVSMLKDRNLVYDILIYERHLPIAVQFVDRHPNQKFVLDHLAKPKVSAGEISPWREQIRELARREHVHCKLSGLVTEAKWGSWTIEDLRPYVEIALEAFGPHRVMAGSDWPVCTLASEYQRWWQTLLSLLSGFSESERNAILGVNAIETYSLEAFEL